MPYPEGNPGWASTTLPSYISSCQGQTERILAALTSAVGCRNPALSGDIGCKMLRRKATSGYRELDNRRRLAGIIPEEFCRIRKQNGQTRQDAAEFASFFDPRLPVKIAVKIRG